MWSQLEGPWSSLRFILSKTSATHLAEFHTHSGAYGHVHIKFVVRYLRICMALPARYYEIQLLTSLRTIIQTTTTLAISSNDELSLTSRRNLALELPRPHSPNLMATMSSEKHENATIPYNTATGPPPLRYPIESKKRALVLTWSVIIFGNTILPVTIFYVLRHGEILPLSSHRRLTLRCSSTSFLNRFYSQYLTNPNDPYTTSISIQTMAVEKAEWRAFTAQS